jgi:hypothetical protein
MMLDKQTGSSKAIDGFSVGLSPGSPFYGKGIDQ